VGGYSVLGVPLRKIKKGTLKKLFKKKRDSTHPRPLSVQALD